MPAYNRHTDELFQGEHSELAIYKFEGHLFLSLLSCVASFIAMFRVRIRNYGIKKLQMYT